MSRKKLMDAIGKIDDRFVDEYDAYKSTGPVVRVLPYVTMAACAALALIVGLVIHNGGRGFIGGGDAQVSNGHELSRGTEDADWFISEDGRAVQGSPGNETPKPSENISALGSDTDKTKTAGGNVKSFVDALFSVAGHSVPEAVGGRISGLAPGIGEEPGIIEDELDKKEPDEPLEPIPDFDDSTGDSSSETQPEPTVEAPAVPPAVYEPEPMPVPTAEPVVTEGPGPTFSDGIDWTDVNAQISSYDHLGEMLNDRVSDNGNDYSLIPALPDVSASEEPPTQFPSATSLPEGTHNPGNSQKYPRRVFTDVSSGEELAVVKGVICGVDNRCIDLGFFGRWSWYNPYTFSENVRYIVCNLTESDGSHMIYATARIGGSLHLNISEISVNMTGLKAANDRYSLPVFPDSVPVSIIEGREIYCTDNDSAAYVRFLHNNKLITLWSDDMSKGMVLDIAKNIMGIQGS